MPASLQLKDIIGPTVSVAAACLSGWFLWKNYRMTRKIADRSVYIDGQKFLIEICKHLMSEPLLWSIYDDGPLQNEHATEIAAPLFQAKLLAFAHLHLNMFEIIMNEAPNPVDGQKQNLSNVWVNYFHDTLSRSHLIREVLEAPESSRIWSAVLLGHYACWKGQGVINQNT
jgi:hypothetical protein